MTRRAEVRPLPQSRVARKSNERGASLIEAMVGMVMMTLILLSLGQAMGFAMRMTVRGREDLRLWADVQQKADSLMTVTVASVVSGADTVSGRPISWTVTGSNPVRVDLAADRQRVTDMGTSQYDLVLYLRN